MADHLTVGNPVDQWWSQTREQIDASIVILSDVNNVDEKDIVERIDIVDCAYRVVRQMPFPHQADEIRSYLLATLSLMRNSLYEEQAGDMISSRATRANAMQKYHLLIYLLLERGIYEPIP